jgi:hypothetical protein
MLGFPGARIFSLDKGPIHEIEDERTESARRTTVGFESTIGENRKREPGSRLAVAMVRGHNEV